VYLRTLGFCFFFSSRRRHTRSYGDWSSDVCSSDLDRVDGPGAWGDVTVFSLRKMAPVPDGAVLVVKPPLSAMAAAPTGPRARVRSEERRVGKECRRRRARE